MATAYEQYDSCPPERFVVEVFSELGQETVQRRWPEVNVILRLSMLSGMQMHLEATLNLLCDFAAEMRPYQRALVYFEDESVEQVQVSVARGFEAAVPETLQRGNILHFWAAKYGRPLLMSRGHNLQADALLDQVQAASALVVPLFV